MRSLRGRAIVGGVAWATVGILFGVFVLFAYIDRISSARFDKELANRHVRLVVALSNYAEIPDMIPGILTDPMYHRPMSGRYWQITDSDGRVWASRSMLDGALDIAGDPSGERAFWSGPGLGGEALRGTVQRVRIPDAGVWTVLVAEELAGLQAERTSIRRSLFLAFALIGIIGVVVGVLQISAVFRPLAKLSRDIARRYDDGETLDPKDYPTEVAPFVADINALLQRNREVIRRSRRQAADLAHALKTPTAIMRNELAMLSDAGNRVACAQDALDRLDAYLMRSLARMRADADLSHVSVRTDLDESLRRMLRAFRTLARPKGVAIEDRIEPGLSIAMDQSDVEEVVGNILDNALKWCASSVRMSAARTEGRIEIVIEDDGPGIDDSDKRKALVSGGRLDTSVPGTGLGLAIATDLMQAYGGTLELGSSPHLGGLAVRLAFQRRPYQAPAARAPEVEKNAA